MHICPPLSLMRCHAHLSLSCPFMVIPHPCTVSKTGSRVVGGSGTWKSLSKQPFLTASLGRM